MLKTDNIVCVAAALIRKGDSFFICQRPRGKARGLLWEFPGGKLEPGETPEDALKRECMEELGIEVHPRDLFMRNIHVYPDLTVELLVFETDIVSGQPQLLEHEAFQYIRPHDIDSYDFCPADEPILKKIRSELQTKGIE